MTGYLQHWSAPPIAVLGTLGLLVGLAYVTPPRTSDAAAQPSRAPLGRVTLVCPEPSAGRVAVAGTPGGDGSGRALVRSLGEEGNRRELGSLRPRGKVWARKLGDDAPTVVVEAEGGMAPGLEAEQVANTGGGPGRGLSATRCNRPRTDFWFVSDGVHLGRSTRLVLVNVDDAPLSVNVDGYGPKGPEPSVAGRGITVQPHSRKILDLGALVPDAPIAALHVHATSGRMLAAVHTSSSGQGRGAQGTDWVPPALSPRKTQVIPGFPKGKGTRRLLLFAPGSRAASVRIQFVTEEGTYAPRGAGEVRVPAGGVKAVELSDTLSRRSAALRLQSDVPVTASAAVVLQSEVAYTAGVPPLRGGAVIADNGERQGVTSTVLVSAIGEPGSVRITLLGPQGRVGQPEEMQVPASRTARVTLSPQALQGKFAVVVTPTEQSGPVYAARLLRENLEGQTSVTLLPLRTSPSWVEVPDADGSLSAVLPD